MTAPAPSLRHWYSTTRWTTYRDQRVVYQRHDGGQGIPTLLIHGFPTASWDWHRVWPDLTALGPLLAPDMLGFGFSAKPHPYPYSIQDQAQLCISLCAELGIDRVHLLAHDYGDSVAQEMLALAPENLRIESVYLLNGGIVPSAHRPTGVQKLLVGPLGPMVASLMSQGGFSRAFAGVFGPSTQPDAGDLAACWQLLEQHGGRRVMPAISQYQRERVQHARRWVDGLAGANCPAGALIGELDPVSGAHMADALAEHCPTLVLTRRQIGHYPQLEAPEAVIEAYLGFRTGDE